MPSKMINLRSSLSERCVYETNIILHVLSAFFRIFIFLYLVKTNYHFFCRIVQIILEQNYDKDHLIARVVRIYVPYWISIARFPPLVYTVVDLSGRREKRHLSVPFHSNITTEKILWQIREEEMVGGYTIASAMNFKLLGFSASINKPGKECFGPIKDLSPLGDMVGFISNLPSFLCCVPISR